MKVYDNVNADLTMQSCGSSWLMILRGDTEAIKQTFDGLYNLGATNAKKPEFTNELETIAWFWSSPKQMKTFFELQFLFRKSQGFLKDLSELKGKKHGFKNELDVFMVERIQTLRATMETFRRFDKRDYNPMFETSSDKAEKPDEDFKDSVLHHAFKDYRNEVDKAVEFD
jgi:hypothetical protein